MWVCVGRIARLRTHRPRVFCARRGGRATNRMAEPLPLSYAVHSGSGVQLQALTTAVFLANATGRALIVPPWLKHKDMPKIMWDPSQITSRKCKTTFIGGTKEKLTHMSEDMLCGLCKQNQTLDAFASLYDFRELVTVLETFTHKRCSTCSRRAAGRCNTCSRRPTRVVCPKTDLDAHLLHLNEYDPRRAVWKWSTTGNSTKVADCGQTLQHLGPSAHSCARILNAVNDASNLSGLPNRSAFCVGPLNDWFFDKPYGLGSTILGRCEAAHPLAKQLSHSGLPLRKEVVSLLPQLFPKPCDVCIYVRLSDGKNDLQRLQDGLYSRDGAKLLTSLAQDWNASKLYDGGLEVVSSCSSAECRDPFNVESPSYHTKLNQTAPSLLQRIRPTKMMAVIKKEELERGVRLLRGLGLTKDNAYITYDQLRCARCSSIYGMAAGSNRNGHMNRGGFRTTSSFFKTITRLHNQLEGQGKTSKPKAEIRRKQSNPSPWGTTWRCNAEGKACVEYLVRPHGRYPKKPNNGSAAAGPVREPLVTPVQSVR